MKNLKSDIRFLAVSMSCIALSGCSGLVDRFLAWAGLDDSTHKSICMVVMPPRIVGYSYAADQKLFETVEFPLALTQKVREKLRDLPRVKEFSVREIAAEERKYYVVAGMRSPVPPRCGASTKNRISSSVDYRQCIRTWAEQDLPMIQDECGESPGFFAAGTEIILQGDGSASVLIKMALINIGTSITSLGKELKTSVKGSDLAELRQQEVVDKVVQEASGPIAQEMERLFNEAQQRR